MRIIQPPWKHEFGSIGAQLWVEIAREAIRLRKDFVDQTGHTGRSGTKTQIQHKTLKLTHKCRKLRIPPPGALVDLLSLCMDEPTTADLSAAQRTAIDFEAKQFAAQASPARLVSSKKVADHLAESGLATVERRQIQRWRDTAEYKDAIIKRVADIEPDLITRAWRATHPKRQLV